MGRIIYLYFSLDRHVIGDSYFGYTGQLVGVGVGVGGVTAMIIIVLFHVLVLSLDPEPAS